MRVGNENESVVDRPGPRAFTSDNAPRITLMDWSDEPATWKQVKFLKEHGCTPDRRLTKMEATELIRTFGGSPEPVTAAAQPAAEQLAPPAAYQLRAKADKARRNLQEAGRNQKE